MTWIPQTGIGIELQGETLRAFCLRRFAGRARVTDHLEIAGIHALGAAKCGAMYRHFLRNNGLKNPWTAVVLPRSMVLWRQVQLPASVAGELRSAVEFQLDSLHPFEEGGVWWDCGAAREGRQRSWRLGAGAPPEASALAADVNVRVAMARKQAVEALADWFRQAGIPVSQFAVSTALLLSLLERVRDSRAAFVLHAQEEECELVGVSPAGGAVFREIRWEQEASGEQRAVRIAQELERARSELRWAPGEPAVVYGAASGVPWEAALEGGEPAWQAAALDSLLEAATGARRIAGLEQNILGVAAAAAAVERAGTGAINLLPAERRSYQSPLAYVPTYALACLVVLLAAALGLRGPFQDWRYSRSLERERLALLPKIQELEERQGQDRKIYDRLNELARLNASAGLPLDLLDELTRLVPSDAWLQQEQYDGSAVTLGGSAVSASAVLQALATSNEVQSPQFLSAVTRSNDGKEGFRIGARLRLVP